MPKVTDAVLFVEVRSLAKLDSNTMRHGLSDTTYSVLATTEIFAMQKSSKRGRELDRLWRRAIKSEPGPIQVIDMFCGAGGMSIGFKALNGIAPACEILGGVDIDQVALQSYRKNLRAPSFSEDVSKLASNPSALSRFLDSVKRDVRRPLVLIGCSPCQGFSSHRRLKEGTDERNTLFSDFARLAVKLRPEVVLVENVPELLSEKNWEFVTTTRKTLERAGYFVNVSFHNAAEFGVPQERFRALIIAMRAPFRELSSCLPRDEFRTVRQTISDLNEIQPGEVDVRDEMHFTVGHKTSTIETIKAVPKDGGNRPADVGPECLRRAHKKQGRGAFDDVYGRLYWDKPAITITAHARNPASGRFVHPEQDRGLTVREAALLQSFPSDYWFAGTLDEKFRQIGNAVPPLFATCIAKHIVTELGRPPLGVNEFTRGLIRPVGASFSRIIPALKAGHRLASDFA